MNRLAAALLSLSLTTGCILSPTDDQRVSNPAAPLAFSGYHFYGSSPVQVQAWNYDTNSMENLGAPVNSAASSSVSLGDQPLYSWSVTRSLAPRHWRTGPVSGQCATIAATTVLNGSTWNLYTVENDWVSCFSSNPTVGAFSAHCASDANPFARLYTSDWGSRTVTPTRLNLVATIASGLISINFDNYQPTEYLHCNAGNPAGCPTGGASDPETWKFFNPNASFVQQATLDGSPGSTFNFSIDPSRSDPMTVYLDDMRSTTLGLRVEGDELVMRVNFEAAGPEIRMNCIRNIACAFVDGRTIDFVAPRAEIRFRLAMQNGKVTYTNATATFTGGTPGDEAVQAEAAIAAAITQKLNADASIKTAVGDALHELVRNAADLGPFPIERVIVSGGSLSVQPACVRD
ncbi:MAG: hypothetical protein ACOZQL_16285 [Myxococcota bacterium]